MRTKRMTIEQKAAVLKFWRTIDGRDRYLSSVFVSAAQSEYWDRCVAECVSQCAELGVPQVHVSTGCYV